MKVKTLYSIELARGLAALSIFVFHLVTEFQKTYGNIDDLPRLKIFLSSGVDLFFIISGFLMVHTTQSLQNRSPKEFLAKRFNRIFPAYWLVLSGLIAIYLLKPQWFPTLVKSQASLVDNIFLLPHAGPGILGVSWTLVYEMYFYLIFAATLFLSPIKQSIVLCFFFVASYLFGLLVAPSDATLVMASSCLLLEFVMGILLAWLWPYLPGKNNILSVLLFGFASAWFLFFPFLEKNSILTSGFPCMLILTGLLMFEKKGFPPRLVKPALFFGAISYTLYLAHLPIMGVALMLIKITHVTPPLSVLITGIIIISFFTATLLHYYFEIPVQKKLRKIFKLHEVPPDALRIRPL